MNTELNTTIGHDVGRRSGKAACRQTLTSQTEGRASAIAQDMAQLISEAGLVDANGMEPLPIARLMGYAEALATAIAMAEACGVRFVTTIRQDGTEGLGAQIDYPPPRALNAPFIKTH